MALMLRLVRRHTPSCLASAPKGKRPLDYRRCACPIYVKGWDGLQKQDRASLRTGDWAEAERLVENMKQTRVAPILLSTAAERFLIDQDRRALARETVRKYRYLLGLIGKVLKGPLEDITPEKLREFLGGLGVAPLTQRKQLERLRSFFKFCVDSNWLAINPALAVRPPQVREKQVMPFTQEEFGKILTACTNPKHRAFILLGRYSGMRIKDVACLEKERIRAGRLFIYTDKTGTPVHLPLPRVVLKALEAFPHVSERYYFWSGNGSRDGHSRSWVDELRDNVFSVCGVAGARSHRLRHTFFVDLLSNGVSLEEAAKLGGHRNSHVTEKYYGAWIKKRQDQAEEAVTRIWAKDPVVVAGMDVKGVQ